MTTDRPAHQPGLGRRHALTGAATIGLGVPLLAACSSDEEPTTASDPGGAPDDGGNADGDGAGAALTSTSEVAVGGGTIIAGQKVVVTQPEDGDFKAFTSICTHQGCQVSSVTDGEIVCRCHGSAFSITDGSVLAGPATSALDEVAITVDGDQISLR